MIEPRDYVTLGTDRMPEGMRKPNALAYISVYLAECTDAETVATTLLNGLLEWNIRPPEYSFALDIIGKLLGQPRPDGFTDTEYQQVLVARSIARVSDADDLSIVPLVAYLSTINGGLGNYYVKGGPPEHWVINIFDVTLTPKWYDTYVALLYDAIGATDSLLLTIGTSATALYDSSVYDASLYG